MRLTGICGISTNYLILNWEESHNIIVLLFKMLMVLPIKDHIIVFLCYLCLALFLVHTFIAFIAYISHKNKKCKMNIVSKIICKLLTNKNRNQLVNIYITPLSMRKPLYGIYSHELLIRCNVFVLLKGWENREPNIPRVTFYFQPTKFT